MEFASPDLNFPMGFCCNCGDLNCASEVQLTRVTRYFAIYGTGTTFRLSLPACIACRRSLRRRPSVFFTRVLVFASFAAGGFLALLALAGAAQLPPWMVEHRLLLSVLLGALATFVFYRLRSPKTPKTSFYQPVRIKQAKVHFAGVMSGPGAVVFMKLAFTNPDYLNAFVNANAEAIKAKHLAVVRA
jgi:hypothetical protein